MCRAVDAAPIARSLRCMTDAFAALHFPRRPWLDASAVRAAFQRLAAGAHPDRAGSTSAFAELSRAYETLRDPALRLRHFLALEQPALAAPREIPGDLIDWFPRVGARLQALKAGDSTDARSTLAALCALREEAHARIREIGAGAAVTEFEELARLLARLGFLDKWIAQLGEALLAREM